MPLPDPIFSGATNPNDPNLDFETIGPDGYAGVENQKGEMEQSFVRAEYARDWNEPGGGDYTKVDALDGEEWQDGGMTKTSEKPGVRHQGQAVAEYSGDGWWLLMLPDGSISEQPSAEDVLRAVRKFFKADIGSEPDVGVGMIEWRNVPEGFMPPQTAIRQTAAHEAAEPCEYGPDVYGNLSSEAEPVGLESIPISSIRGSAIKREWPSIDDDAAQRALRAWSVGEYDQIKPLQVYLIDGEYWLWDGHSRYVMYDRVNPGGSVLCNVVERFPVGMAKAAGALDGDMNLVVDGEPMDHDEIDGWETYEKTHPTEMVQMDAPFTVHTLEGPMDADAGDFLAKGPEGELYPIDGDIQPQTYRKAGMEEEWLGSEPSGGFQPGDPVFWMPQDYKTRSQRGTVDHVAPEGIYVRLDDGNTVTAPKEKLQYIGPMQAVIAELEGALRPGDRVVINDPQALNYEDEAIVESDFGDLIRVRLIDNTGPSGEATLDVPPGLLSKASRVEADAADQWNNGKFYPGDPAVWTPNGSNENPQRVTVISQDGDGIRVQLDGDSRTFSVPPDELTYYWRGSQIAPRSAESIAAEADASPTGMFSWEGGTPDPFPADDDSMPNSANPDGVNRNLSPELRSDPSRRRGIRTAAATLDPIADGLNLSRSTRVVLAGRRVGNRRQEVMATLADLEGSLLPEQVARYHNMLAMNYDPDLILARINEDRPYLERYF